MRGYPAKGFPERKKTKAGGRIPGGTAERRKNEKISGPAFICPDAAEPCGLRARPLRLRPRSLWKPAPKAV